MIEGTRTCVGLSILTVGAVDFSSETSGNTFGVSRVTVWYACESFLNTNLAANSVEFQVSRKHHMTFHWLKSYCTYGQFGSTLWSVWWEKARPSKNKTTNLILNILYFSSFLLKKQSLVSHTFAFLLQSKYRFKTRLSRSFRMTLLKSRILIVLFHPFESNRTSLR